MGDFQPPLLRSALLLVQPNAETLIDAEKFTGTLRALLADCGLPAGFTAQVTGMSAMFYDLNRRSSADLLRAEAVGIPLTLIVLFLVFRTAIAAGLALAIAASAVILSSAFLYATNAWLPASVLAQNVVTMIGLGAGTDYALFVLSHHRLERSSGASPEEAVARAVRRAGPTILVAGMAVAGGFAALFLVNARFVHSLALGGVGVIVAAVAAALTLLPALLRLFGDRVIRKTRLIEHTENWSRGAPAAVDEENAAGAPHPHKMSNHAWARWANAVMARPWTGLVVAIVISALWGWPAWRTHAWKIGPYDLAPEDEARRGYDVLAAQFQPGWMGPVVLTLEAKGGHQMWEAANQQHALEIVTKLQREPLVAHVLGYPRLLDLLGDARIQIHDKKDLLPYLAKIAQSAVSANGRIAIIVVVPRVAAEADSAVQLITRLRSGIWFDADPADLSVKVGGGTAIVHDFDTEMFQSVGRVMAVVVALTFGLLLVFFRSIVVPLKAIAANLLSVFAAYGFLVLLFQDGIGARALGITPPGGLNSFVVLMLFTILFGLSMDYEIFLLSQIRDEFRLHGDNERSVAAGLTATAGIITSAAAVMVCLFGSFGFVGLTASRQFGLGLAFAVAFDATIVRLLIVPATMRLLGKWNWWLPGMANRESV